MSIKHAPDQGFKGWSVEVEKTGQGVISVPRRIVKCGAGGVPVSDTEIAAPRRGSTDAKRVGHPHMPRFSGEDFDAVRRAIIRRISML